MVFHAKDAPSKAFPGLHGGIGDSIISKADVELAASMPMFIRLTLPVGATVGYHEHHGETEYFIFTSGSGRVRDDDTYVDICAGDVTSTSSGHGHSIENTGDTDLTYYAFVVKD